MIDLEEMGFLLMEVIFDKKKWVWTMKKISNYYLN